jgi:putative component of membrane protein insertase Oxa1/YidC/SpoIIIJ protein YidD
MRLDAYKVFDWFLSMGHTAIPKFGLKFYRMFIRPIWGKPCPHWVYYGGDGCSTYASEALINMSAGEARAAIHARLMECGEAARHLANTGQECGVGCKSPAQG